MSILFFTCLAVFSTWDIFRLAKEKKKREMVVYIIIAVLSVTAGLVYVFNDTRLTDVLRLSGG